MKLTPLNIVLACFLTWAISEWGNDELRFSLWALLAFVLVIVFTDVLFRIFIKELKKLWMGQIAFVLIAGILLVLVKVLWK